MNVTFKRRALDGGDEVGAGTSVKGSPRRPRWWFGYNHVQAGSTNLTGARDGAIEPAYTPGEHVPVLDGLRGVAILLVVLHHAIYVTLAPGAIGTDEVARAVTSVGWTGVDLFFVLSGFLITGILLDTQRQPRWWVNFITRRALRIFPLYYGVLIILFVLLPRLVHMSAIPEFLTLQANQRWYWTYTVNLYLAPAGAFLPGHGTMARTAHFWSLSVEEQFYLIWPLIVWMCKPRTLLRVVALTMMGGFAFRLGVVLHDPLNGNNLALFLTPGRLDGLMIGAALAVVARSTGGLARLKTVAPWVLGASVIAITTLVMLKGGLDYADPIVVVAGLPVIVLGYGALLVMALTGSPTTRLVRTLGGVALRKWGKYSYGIYVIHWSVLGVITGNSPFYQPGGASLEGSRLPGVLLFAVVGMSLSYTLAWLSYHLYEKRFLELKRYFARKPVARTTSGSALYRLDTASG